VSIGRLNITGSEITVIHSDGTTEAFDTLRARAESTLPAELQGQMDQSTVSEKSGNVRISFNRTFFPRKGNMGDQEYRLVADASRLKRLLITSAIYNELMSVGVPWDHMTFKDSWFKPKLVNGKPVVVNGRTEGSYEPTMQLWLNNSRTSEGVVAAVNPAAPTLQSLSTEYVMCHDDAAEGGMALNSLKAAFEGDPVTFMAVLSSSIAKLKIQASAPAVETVDGEMPQG
jgi:hypothetical protein